MNAIVFVRIPVNSSIVVRPIEINENKTIKDLKSQIISETREVNDEGFSLKPVGGADGEFIDDTTLIKYVTGFDARDGSCTLDLVFQLGGGRRYKRKVRKTKKLNKKKKVRKTKKLNKKKKGKSKRSKSC